MAQFDPVRASFWLLAFVLGVYSFLAIVGVGVCSFGILVLRFPVGSCQNSIDAISGLLAAALAAALAFSTKSPPKE